MAVQKMRLLQLDPLGIGHLVIAETTRTDQLA